jgi:hypothetical protein
MLRYLINFILPEISSFYSKLSFFRNAKFILALSLLLPLTMWGQSWNTLGSAGFSAGEAGNPALAISLAGTPYVAYSDSINSQKATVMKFNGTSWVTVGNAGFSDSIVEGNNWIAIDGGGTPYVAYRDFASGYKATVMKFNGSSWVVVGNAGFSTGAATGVSIAIDGTGTPYVVYSDGVFNNKATVMKFDGSSWVQVGSALSSGAAYYPSIAIDGSNVPYVAYEDGLAGKATVMKYNGSSWVNVYPTDFSSGIAQYISLAVNSNGTPYVAYEDNANGDKATVMQYTGSNWVVVGSVGFSSGSADFTSIAINSNGTPYVAYRDYANSQKATVMKFNGSNWVTAGSAGFSAGSMAFSTIAIDGNSSPYVAYYDFANGDKATVMKLSIAPITGNTALCAGDTSTLNDTTSNGIWSSNDTGIAKIGINTGIVTGIAAGTATVSYTVSGISATFNITVNELPGIPAISSNSPVCSGDSLNIYANDTTMGVSYSWTGPNNITASVQNIQVHNAVTMFSGTYYATAILNACTITDSINVVVMQSPAALSAGSNSPLCATNSLQLMASDTSSGISYGWSGPNFFNSSSQNPVITNATIADSGWYYVSASLSSCQTKDSVYVNVNPLPALPSAGSNSLVCEGDSLLLTATDVTAGVVFSWYGPANFNSLSQNPFIANVSAANAGQYTVNAFLNGCIAGTSINVTISPAPSLPSVSSNSPLCAGNTLYLNATSTTSGVTFYWIGPNGFIDSTQNPEVSNVPMSDSGEYKIYSRSGLCYSDTNGTVVIVNPVVMPSVSISTIPAVITIGSPIQFIANITNGGPFPGIQWRRNGVDIPGATVNNCYITLAQGDVISVFVQSDAPCPLPDSIVSGGVTVGVNNLQFVTGSLQAYPNPCNGNLFLSFIEEGGTIQDGAVSIEVLNLLGQVVYNTSAKIEKGKLERTIDINAADGTYMLRVVNEAGNSFSQQIVIGR